MCNEEQLARMGRAAVNRRDFGKIGALAALATACAPADAQGQARPQEEEALFPAPNGRMDAYFVHPPTGKFPAIIVWPDVAGLRDAFMAMGRRLAREGYAVLVLNPYYADGEAPQFDDFDDYRENGGSDKVGPWREKLTAPNVMEIAKAAVAFLDKQPSVDTAKGIGTQGYCMGGALAVWTAAGVPDRVKAVASFHGGRLVTNTANPDDPNLPVKLLGQTQASYLFAIARDDDRAAPTDKDALKAAATAASRPAEVTVYAGDHGWTVVDSPAYEDTAAERAWDRLLNLYKTAL